MLHYPGPLLDSHAWVPEAGSDDTIGHTFEMGDGGIDRGCQMLIARLIPLGPGGAQAMIGCHLLEQLLGNKKSVIGHCHGLDQCPQSQEVVTGQT